VNNARSLPLARPARGRGKLRMLTDAEDIAPYLEDSARTPGGHARAVVLASDKVTWPRC